MIFKEDFVPPTGARILFNLAPVMAFAPAFALMAVVPIGPDFSAFGTEVRFQVARLDVGLIFIFAIASLAVYGTTLAGWSANNKFALLGGLRATAQMISYEVTLALTLVGSFILYETLRPHEMVAFQQGTMWGGLVPTWGVFFQPFAMVFFLAAAFAEIKRAPFDLPEGESEIIGYFVEYSGMKFGLFMIAEFVEIVVLSAVIVVIFFGGWSIPWVSHEALVAWLSGTVGLGPDWGALAAAFLALFVFITKMMFFVWLQMLIRWSFPRFRYDQIMDLGWKMLLPLSIANVVITAVAVVLDPTLNVALALGLVQLVALLAIVFSAAAPSREEALPEEAVPGGH
jgi:NADH-quinone oxidoreductase subunit H